MSNGQKAVVAVVAVVGVVAIAVGIVYLTVPAHSLPSIMGTVQTAGHRSKRGVAALVGGVVLLAIAGGIMITQSPSRRRHRY